jgi:hypothetical protein
VSGSRGETLDIFLSKINLLTLTRHYCSNREANEPYSRGQWDSALKATPHPLRVMFRTSRP